MTFTQAGAVRDHPGWKDNRNVMLAEHYDVVIGGDPDRDTIDLAVLDTGGGRVLAHVAHVADTADGAGYRLMLAWAGGAR